MTALSMLAEISARVAATPARLEKVREIAAGLRLLSAEEVPIGLAYLSGELPQGRLGLRYAALRDALSSTPAAQASLNLLDVDEAFSAIRAIRGAGTESERMRALASLFGRATREERDFLARLVAGELRQGALKGVMQDAVAAASGLPASEIRQAAMAAGGVGPVAQAALGSGSLENFAIRLMQPVLPMLSQSASDIQEALLEFGTAALEWKLDGARIQVHKDGGTVRVFTRNLRDVTPAVPEIVAVVRANAKHSLIIDGEVIALHPDGSPYPFQDTMRRFGRMRGVEALQAELPLTPFFFDCLFCDGLPLAARPASERFDMLRDALPEKLLVPRIVTADAGEAARFFEDALRHGHEGLMVKALDAPYEAGRRGAGWIKVKCARTLDLVVLAAEWGNGRRKGKLSNLHLGAREPSTGGFVMLGKTFKGMTDAMLEWQTTQFLVRETSRDAITVYVRPEMVVEIAFNEIQASPRYPGGLALRFARVKGYRTDKGVAEADTIDTVRDLYEAQARSGQRRTTS